VLDNKSQEKEWKMKEEDCKIEIEKAKGRQRK
jgi:hypothetical protein